MKKLIVLSLLTMFAGASAFAADAVGPNANAKCSQIIADINARKNQAVPANGSAAPAPGAAQGDAH